MTDWTKSSALDACRAGTQAACIVGENLSIRELPATAKLVFQARGKLDTLCQDASRLVGLQLPVTPNTSITGKYTVLWLSPGKWLIILDPRYSRELRQQLESAFSGIPCLVSDASDARTGIEVAGTRARALLARVCALDLDARFFGPGQCAQTLLARVPLLIHQVDSLPAFHLFVDRSLAGYAWEWLADAAADFITGPVT